MAEVRKYGNASRDVRDDIKQILLDRELRPGAALPSEAVLIDILGVSRGTLREALKSLQATGIIETRHGTGSFVGQPSLRAMADGLMFHSRLGEGQDNLTTASDLADIREILETELIRRVATGAGDDQLQRLDALVEEMDARREDRADLDDVDHQFHRELYAELGNALVLQLLDVFWSALGTVRESLPMPFDTPEDAVRKHRAIVDALVLHDAEAAEAAIKDHFALTRTWIRQGMSG
jgi:DNA-binding FadR family transcriptional regulator